MCKRSMVDIQSVAAEIRRGKKEEEYRRKKLQGKNIMTPLLHRAAINSMKIKFAGVSQTNEKISAASGPKFTIL